MAVSCVIWFCKSALQLNDPGHTHAWMQVTEGIVNLSTFKSFLGTLYSCWHYFFPCSWSLIILWNIKLTIEHILIVWLWKVFTFPPHQKCGNFLFFVDFENNHMITTWKHDIDVVLPGQPWTFPRLELAIWVIQCFSLIYALSEYCMVENTIPQNQDTL